MLRNPPTQIGERFGRLVIVADSGAGHRGERLVSVRCDCGVEKTVFVHNLRSGGTRSCGCALRGYRGGVKIGQRFGRLMVVAEVGMDKQRHPLFACLCECGVEKTTSGYLLSGGRTRSCGCLRREGKPQMKPEIGNRYGRLTVLGEADRDKQGARLLRVRCDCGAEKIVRMSYLRNGSTRSCGHTLCRVLNKKNRLEVPGYIDVREAAAILGCTINQVRARVTTGTLPHVRVGVWYIRVPRDAVEKMRLNPPLPAQMRPA
jgi:excisionase family DNA binding protein